jgi:histidine triad (HIT) family protein
MNDNCLFCRMSRGDVPIDKVFEDDQVFAIRDINPRAPVHIMVIPREHIPSAAALTEAQSPLLAHIVLSANRVAAEQGIGESGYRLALNIGDDAGQTIYHLHLHLLGGRELGPEA